MATNGDGNNHEHNHVLCEVLGCPWSRPRGLRDFKRDSAEAYKLAEDAKAAADAVLYGRFPDLIDKRAAWEKATEEMHLAEVPIQAVMTKLGENN
jgi:hypothetical protein